MTTVEPAYRPVPKTWRQARSALLLLCLAAWVFMSGTIALAGWGTRSALHQNFGLVLLALGVVVGGGSFVTSRWRLQRHAARSLQARADLEGLELDEKMEATLVVFDLTRGRVANLLKEPALKDVVAADAINRDLAASGEELYQLARRSTELRSDRDRLARQAQTGVVASAQAANEEETARIEAASTRIAEELQALEGKIDATRSLARSATGGEASTQRLREASREIDASAAAIKELARLNDR